ncbi:2-nitropropane dioxygenase [Schizophyllum fasciatum]
MLHTAPSTSSRSLNLTRLTDISADVRTPVLCAPMAGASGGALAAECTLGGGFGFLGAGTSRDSQLRDELSVAAARLSAQAKGTRLPVGVGFLGWQLDSGTWGADLIRVALEQNVAAIWLAFGDNSNIAQWARFIREHETPGPRTLLFLQTASPSDALAAVEQWNADVIVAQGCESGGHGFADAPPLMSLLPAMRAALPAEVPVVVAGGLATGSQLAGMLTMGAAGAVYGTRFLLSPESKYSDGQRAALLAASSASTVRTMAFDHVRGTLGWPAGVDGRGIRNETVADFESGGDRDEMRRKFQQALKQDDTSRTIVWAGTGVGLMDTVKPAKDIVKELHEDCVRYMAAVTHVFNPAELNEGPKL